MSDWAFYKSLDGTRTSRALMMLRYTTEAIDYLSGTTEGATYYKRISDEMRDRGEQLEPSLRYEDVRFVKKKGWSEAQFIAKICELDEELTENLTDENEAPLAEQIRTFFGFPDTWRLIVDRDDRIVGYWRLSPLIPEMYEKARSGKLLDKELVVEAMPDFVTPRVYDVYVAFMGIKADSRTAAGFRVLLESILSVLNKLANADIFVGRMCANGLSPLGDALCRSRMKHLCKHEFKGEVYEVHMYNLLNDILPDTPSLARKYELVWLAYHSRFSGEFGKGISATPGLT